jgi:N-acylglucosamine 2-epimerase
MYARICAKYDDITLRRLSGGKLDRSAMIDAATKAAKFMTEHGIRDDGMVYFSLNRDGQPYHFERKIFSACFLSLGCGVLSSVTGSVELRGSSVSLLNSVIRLAHDPSPLGRPSLPGAPVTSPMNVPMIILNLIDELKTARVVGSASEDGTINYDREEAWCVEEILKHVFPHKKIVLETVNQDGTIIPNNYDGRHMNPGHAIEAGWFLLQYARRTGNSTLSQTAVDMIQWSFDIGWDKDFGGLFYFLDSEGRSPPYLEWNMKLWWPHCEAMVAFAMLLEEHSDMWSRFVQVSDYTLKTFSAATDGGEWFGYCDRAGKPTHRFKGGPYKGCFHVPRALFFTYEILDRLMHPN